MSNYNLNVSNPIMFRASCFKKTVPSDIKTSTDGSLDFAFTAINGLTERKFNGKIDGAEYEIKQMVKPLKSDDITGKINGKVLNLQYQRGFKDSTIKGTFDNKPVDLNLEGSLNGYKVTGTFNGKNVNYTIKAGLNGYDIVGQDTNLEIKNNLYYGKDINAKGKYNGDKDLMPLLLTTVYDLCNTDYENMMAGATALTMLI